MTTTQTKETTMTMTKTYALMSSPYDGPGRDHVLLSGLTLTEARKRCSVLRRSETDRGITRASALRRYYVRSEVGE